MHGIILIRIRTRKYTHDNTHGADARPSFKRFAHYMYTICECVHVRRRRELRVEEIADGAIL